MSFHSILNRLAAAPAEYVALPTTTHPQPACYLPRRYPRFILAVLAALLLYLFFSPHLLPAYPEGHEGKPPLYEDYREYERHLSAHSPDLPYPDGKHAKFIYFGNHQKGVGWGNVLQEMIYNAYFAYHVKRSFVFYNYTWDLEGPPYSKYNGHLIPSRIPLTAFISGPIVGGPMGADDVEVPRAVSLDYFNQICPKKDRHIIDGGKVKEGMWDPSAKQLLNALVDKIHATDARCIELPRGTAQIFDFILFGSDHVLDLWPDLQKSPIFTQFNWSPLIHDAYKTNSRFFELSPSSPSSSFFASLYAPISKHVDKLLAPSDPPSPPFQPLDGLLALHIRRGDFDEHCWHFIRYGSGYNGYNSFSGLPDHFVPRANDAELYMRHCFPNVTQIVERVAEVRARTKGLKKVYVMTNGKREWLAELKMGLESIGGWEQVATSRDLSLSWEQKPIGQALDMYVAQRAQVFIGNGFSSLTSNIVMFRMGNPLHHPNNTFFW